MKTVSTMILPRIQGMMTGVWKIDRAHDLVVLHYQNHTQEAAKIPKDRWKVIASNPFAIVSEVQSHRQSATP